MVLTDYCNGNSQTLTETFTTERAIWFGRKNLYKVGGHSYFNGS